MHMTNEEMSVLVAAREAHLRSRDDKLNRTPEIELHYSVLDALLAEQSRRRVSDYQSGGGLN
jgi:hypothetical protein